MKRTKKIIALGMALILLLSFTACSMGVKEYDKDSMVSLLQNKLSISESDIHVVETDGTTGTPAATVITSKYNDARINVSICKNAEDAADYFKKAYDSFKADFNTSSQFSGSSISMSGSGSGYIVIKGEKSGTSLFGDINRTGNVYGGLYYTGSEIVLVMSEAGKGIDDVGKIIDALGYPNV